MVTRSLNTHSLNTRTLQAHSLPMRLYEASKSTCAWNPSRLDFSQDRTDWESLEGRSRLPILAVTVLASECLCAQMHNSTILSMAIEDHASIEERLCFTSLVFEAARFTELYNRVLQDTIPLVGDPDRFHNGRFGAVLGEQLPSVLDRLKVSSSLADLVEALTYYGPVGKGILGSTGIFMLRSLLEGLDIMPTLRGALVEQRLSARRHVDFTTFFIGKLVEQRPELWEIVEDTMNAAFEPALGVVREFYDRFNPSVLARAEAVTFAVEQFAHAYEQLESVHTGRRAQGQALEARLPGA